MDHRKYSTCFYRYKHGKIEEKLTRKFTFKNHEAEEFYWNGYGIKINEKGKYIGEFKNGEREGYGRFQDPNGDEYVGQWERGERHGEGVLKKYWREISRVEYKQGSLILQEDIEEDEISSQKDEEDEEND